MKKQPKLILSLFISFSWPQVFITEVMYNLPGADSPNEFVELYNADDISVDLTDWIIADLGSDDDLVGESFLLPPNGYALIMEGDYDGILYSDLIPQETLMLFVDGNAIGNNLNNSADSLYLINSVGDTIDVMGWSESIEDGFSLEKVNLEFGNISGNWRMSLIQYGTPGFENSVSDLQRDVAIDSVKHDPQFPGLDEPLQFEVFVSNRGFEESMVQLYMNDNYQQTTSLLPQSNKVFQVNHSGLYSGTHLFTFDLQSAGDNAQDNNSATDTVFISFQSGSVLINEIMYDPLSGNPEWVEVVNKTGQTINFLGWGITDQSNDLPDGILQSVEIIPNGFLVLNKENTNNSWIVQDDFPGLNNDGDDLRLIDPTGIEIDRVDYSDNWGGGDGYSLERVTSYLQSNDPANWGTSINTFGATPREVNSLHTAQIEESGTIVIEPNPFSPDGDGHEDILTVSYHLPFSQARLNVDIFSLDGYRMVRLSKGETVASQGFLKWDGFADNGQKCMVGQYLLKFNAADMHSKQKFQKIERVILAKKLK